MHGRNLTFTEKYKPQKTKMGIKACLIIEVMPVDTATNLCCHLGVTRQLPGWCQMTRGAEKEGKQQGFFLNTEGKAEDGESIKKEGGNEAKKGKRMQGLPGIEEKAENWVSKGRKNRYVCGMKGSRERLQRIL